MNLRVLNYSPRKRRMVNHIKSFKLQSKNAKKTSVKNQVLKCQFLRTQFSIVTVESHRPQGQGKTQSSNHRQRLFEGQNDHYNKPLRSSNIIKRTVKEEGKAG